MSKQSRSRRCVVENISRGDCISQFVLWVSHLEDVGHELRDAVAIPKRINVDSQTL